MPPVDDGNTGDTNTGDTNTGDTNTGDTNTGDTNTGDTNTGDTNTDTKDKEGDSLLGNKKPVEAPETYEDFTLPDGVEMDAPALESFQALAKEVNLPQESAQKFVDMQVKFQAEAATKAAKDWNDTVEGWQNDVRSDTELGGPALEASIGNAKLFLKEFGSPELTALLDSSGFGNHKEFIRAFARAGKAMGEDQLTTGGKNSPTPKSPEDIMYPDQGKV